MIQRPSKAALMKGAKKKKETHSFSFLSNFHKVYEYLKSRSFERFVSGLFSGKVLTVRGKSLLFSRKTL